MIREIQYHYSTKAILIFDEGLQYHASGKIDTLVNQAEYLMDTYRFTDVDAIDETTGELLFSINDYE